MPDTVVGVFQEWDAARAALDKLRQAGFPPEEVTVLAADRDRDSASDEELDREEEGTMIGAAAGGALGAAGGWMIGLAALAVPGIGPILAAGPLLAAVAGLAAGAGVGGLIGHALGGTTEEERAAYEEAFHRGEILVSITDAERSAEAARLLVEAGGLVAEPAADRPDSDELRRKETADAALAGLPAEVSSPAAPRIGVPGERVQALDVPGAHTSGLLPDPSRMGGVTDPDPTDGPGAPGTGAFGSTEQRPGGGQDAAPPRP